MVKKLPGLQVSLAVILFIQTLELRKQLLKV